MEQLSQADVDHFLQHGWIKLSDCFSREDASAICDNVWTRLGMDPSDQSSWKGERINMPAHHKFSAKEFAPKAWTAICDLLGGESKVSEDASTWGDGLIVNLGTESGAGKDVPGNELRGWHVDGDFFVHYLDSPEQALLVVPLFTDINPGGGGTFLCPSGIGHVAKHLYNHPEGVSPRMTPRSQNPAFDPEPTLQWYNTFAAQQNSDQFVEATGSVGDVYLLHPLMLHSASNNKLRALRIITNPPVSLKQPFQFDRADKSYSIVEQKTLMELGKASLPGWSIEASREPCIPERLRIQARLKEQELDRLKAVSAAARETTVTA